MEKEEKGTQIHELKDGQSISWENVKFVLQYMLDFKDPSTLLKYFHNMDKKETKVRTKIDTLINLGTIEMVKKDMDKKKEEEQKVAPKVIIKEDDTLIVTKKKKKKGKKKLTKKQLKELKEKQRNG